MTAATAPAIPFVPFQVSALHTAVTEVEFARQALRGSTGVRKAYAQHALVGGAGLACFALEQKAIDANFIYMHAMWHLLACWGVANTNVLLRRQELKQELYPESAKGLVK